MSFKIVCENRKAYHEYEILETFEAGIVLDGKEIKAIRAGKVNLTGSYARVFQTRNPKSEFLNPKQTQNLKSKNPKLISYLPRGKAGKLPIRQAQGRQADEPELFLIGAHISVIDGDPTRTRKLLMHRKEINRLIGKTQEKNLTLIPTKLYLKNGKAKIELGLGKGKKLHDKREVIKKRDLDRENRIIM